MNIEVFRKHNASRKITCKPLESKKVEVQFPVSYAEVTPDTHKLVFLDECEVASADLESSTQYIILNISEDIADWIHEVEGHERKDVRLSRFKTSFGGMQNPPIRVWKDGERTDEVIDRGCVVRCGFTMRESKGRFYFDLHRDIDLVKAPAKRRKVMYLSDGESE